MKYFSWILTVPIMIVAVVFAVTNRGAATLNLWPFGITVEAPLFILVLGSALFGIVVGGAIAWLSAGRQRRRARAAEARAAAAERELSILQRKMAQEANPPAARGLPNPPANDSFARPAGPNTLPAGRR